MLFMTYDLLAQTYAEQKKEEDIQAHSLFWLIGALRSLSANWQARALNIRLFQLLELELLKVETAGNGTAGSAEIL